MCSSTSPAKAALNSSMLVDVVLDSAASEVMAVDGNGVLQKHGTEVRYYSQMAVVLGE